ncbi:hypothetical protein ONB66_00400 [Candidatus Vidania fulgoroideae]|uniref:Shikimate dehydrogenase substrate binding N-terminal domain-containing protein n=1 Tax=Candidatus Vidania fulgoroideorum TaxID=881286 RepID=A0AAX3NA82_9PROT|nr:hypothetical protein ONB67_00485 [Candidatus Vidania fulgoroideae]WDR79474.1 hypothetical protein ONB66_00400 [Candidatus Vidania fulgoroideae]
MFCVIGNPIKHSLSKNIQNIFIKTFNFRGYYMKFKFHIITLYKKIIELLINNFNFNITIPFKETIVKINNFCEKENISFNTTLNNKNCIIVFNTDKYYFNKKFKKTEKKFLIVGFGGVAKSILLFFLYKKKNNFYILSRKDKKIKKFSKLLNKKIKIYKKEKYDIIIDCTPCILYNKIPYNIKKESKIISLNYKNINLYKKKKLNCILSGENLLITQALQSFKIWNKIKEYKFNKIKKYLIENFNDKS